MFTDGIAEALANHVIARWSSQRFDTVGVYPSGYCYPINSSAVPQDAPFGYEYHPLHSAGAFSAVAAAIRDGAAYNFREMGRVKPVPFESLLALKRKRLLVVDDRADTRELLTVILETCGAEVESACSAAATLEALKTSTFDVLVADIMMPEQNGYELIGAIRALGPKQGGRIPAVALTALSGPEDKAVALAAGFQIHLAKPVDPSELCDAIVSLLSS